MRLGETEYVVAGYGQALEGRRSGFEPYTITLFPAGHVLGSALVRIEAGSGSLLYTGDVNVVPARTCAAAVVPEADVLVTEATFGRPGLSFPPVDDLRRRLVDEAREALAGGFVPVFLGYALGKGPEVAKILLEAGVPVAVHEAIARLLPVYEAAGTSFASVVVSGHGAGPCVARALVVPPSARWQPAPGIAGPRRVIAVTGRTLLDPSRPPMRADVAVPLSDHADFDGLLRVADLSGSRKILTTHGLAEELSAALRERGKDATTLGKR